MLLLCLVWFLTTCMGVSSEDLNPVNKQEYYLEGTSVIVSYKYSKKATGVDQFYWYRQDTRQRPEFFIYILGSDGETKKDSQNPRRSVKMSEDRSRVDLEISSAEVTDSALYYCAVKPTVTGNPETLYKNVKLSMDVFL
ncbi:hypothetical protein DPEC_G00063340 [Dallia pectoralis]|uniref:Uncharacterized protein n=1 Tax=Dallia pectoralis TaxID=75939 RepID=A0ACC2H826_DALPE|nr:hypothetical protein DPEC_G00063340 [Dallia pectoralis]